MKILQASTLPKDRQTLPYRTLKILQGTARDPKISTHEYKDIELLMKQNKLLVTKLNEIK